MGTRARARHRQRIAEAQIEPARQAQLSTHANGQHTAVHEDHRAWLLCRDFDDTKRPVVVQRHMVHRREEAHPLESKLRQRVPRTVGGIARAWIDHEESDKPGRVPCHRSRDGRLVARHARDQDGALNMVRIELPNPAIGKRFGGSRIVPSKLAIQVVDGSRRRALACKGREERGREEVAVRVVDQNVTLNPT